MDDEPENLEDFLNGPIRGLDWIGSGLGRSALDGLLHGNGTLGDHMSGFGLGLDLDSDMNAPDMDDGLLFDGVAPPLDGDGTLGLFDAPLKFDMLPPPMGAEAWGLAPAEAPAAKRMSRSSARASFSSGMLNSCVDEGENEEGEEEGEGEREGQSGGRSRGSTGSLARGATAEERRAQRLEKNRESARQSRQRKKDYLDELSRKVGMLQRDLFEKRATHLATATAELGAQRAALLASLEPLAHVELSGGVLPSEDEAKLEAAAAALCDRYGPDSAERRAVRDFHFNQLARLLTPPHTKFMLWLIYQPEGSSSGISAEAATAASLWSHLCTDLGLSSEQGEKLRASLRRVAASPEAPHEVWRLCVAAVYLSRLRGALSKSAAKLQAQLEATRAILTPAQFLRYAAWVDRNRARLGRAVTRVTVMGEGMPPSRSSM